VSSRRRRDDQLRRDARRRAVVLERERLQHRAHVLAADVLEVEAVAVDELAVPQREDLDGGVVAPDRDPDHVDAADGALVGRLPLGEVADREQPVPVAGGVLEARLRRRRAHPPLEVAQHRPRLA
jgi:hypothetical protein